MAKRQKILFYLGAALLLSAITVLLGYGYVKLDVWRIQKSKEILIESQKVNDKKDCLVLLQKATLLDPSENNYLLTGVKATENGYDKLATHYFEKIKTANGYYELGQVYYKSNKLKDAEKAFKKSLSINKTPKAYLGLGKTYLKEGEITKAQENFKLSYSMASDNKEALYYNDLIKLYFDKEIKFVPDEKNYRRSELNAIAQSPALSMRINWLYQYLLDNDYPQAAFTFLRGRSETSQLNRDGYLLLANEYYIRKTYKESYQYLLSAKTIDPYYPQTYQHLVEVADLLNKNDEAKQYREFLKNIIWQ
ncbi:MAG: tetratricopeptide repeat protein [bacterium]